MEPNQNRILHGTYPEDYLSWKKPEEVLNETNQKRRSNIELNQVKEPTGTNKREDLTLNQTRREIDLEPSHGEYNMKLAGDKRPKRKS